MQTHHLKGSIAGIDRLRLVFFLFILCLGAQGCGSAGLEGEAPPRGADTSAGGLASFQDEDTQGGSLLTAGGPISLLAAPGKCLDVRAANPANGTPVQIYDCNQSAAQSWTFVNGSLQVLGNKCLDVTDGADAPGTRLQIWECANHNPNQQWQVSGNALVWTGRGKCLDLPGGDQTNGTQLQIVGCEAGNPNQQWRTGQTNPPPVPEEPTRGSIALRAAPGKCIDVQAGSNANGTAVQIYDCNQTPAQTWSLKNGSLEVLAGKCLDVTGGVDAPGTRVQIWDCASGNPNQQWQLAGQTIKWTGRGKCLDLPNGDTTNGNPLQIVGCEADNPNQQWQFGQGSKPPLPNQPDFGPNVSVFTPQMSRATIQAKLNQVYGEQTESDEFAPQRHAFLFHKGSYQLDVKLGYYMTAQGLGESPDDVLISGAVRAKADWFYGGNATKNFWRGAENMAVIPWQDGGRNMWAVSQATWLRRFHVKGKLALSEDGEQSYSSGGFIADSLVDGAIDAGTQQQFLARNARFASWSKRGVSWNFVFVGSEYTPAGEWPYEPHTVVPKTPVVREKPYLRLSQAGEYQVVVPALKTASQGPSWGAGQTTPQVVLPLSTFHIAIAGKDSAESLNAALAAGKHLLITPGIYRLNAPLLITKANTVVLGLGLATLLTTAGTAAMEVADVDGVSIAGLMLDAGAQNSLTMLRLGRGRSGLRHASNPTALHDVFCRVGGAQAAKTESCVIVDSHDVLIDNIWLWRADHGQGVGWYENPSQHGITVNADHVTAYGLFVEHFQAHQTIWNGNGGRVYLYQSELPYDVPYQDAWKYNGSDGYASYKVNPAVTSHMGLGLGVYAVFDKLVHLENAIETPTGQGIVMQHMVTLSLSWRPESYGSSIRHIINGSGKAVKRDDMWARSPY